MRGEIQKFVSYLQDVKKTAKNTQLSYERDLRKLADYFEQQNIIKVEEITSEGLKAYLSHLEEVGKKPSTMSRTVASIKAFYQFLKAEGLITEDASAALKAPKVEKKLPSVLALEDVDLLLAQPNGDTDKEIRDKAMLELLYATGMRVSELLRLELRDLNLNLGYVTINPSSGKERLIPITKSAKLSCERYLNETRQRMMTCSESELVFVNCSGKSMSRQGFWKIIKHYAKEAGIEADITPNTLRHTFAAHLVKNGANLHAVQEMMGHSDFSSTQRYTRIDSVREEYEKAHPRN